MSGFGRPARTATPMPDLATSARLPATSLPSEISLSMLGAAMRTISTTSPPLMRLVIASVPVQIVVTLWPLDFSKAGTSARTTSLTAADAITLISAACAVVVPITITVATDIISADTIEFIRALQYGAIFFLLSRWQVTTAHPNAHAAASQPDPPIPSCMYIVSFGPMRTSQRYVGT